MLCAKSALNWPDGSESGVKDGNGIDCLIIGLPYRQFLSHLTAYGNDNNRKRTNV